jgi:ribokinase
MTPIYIVGSSNTDMVVKSEKIPAPGETVLGGTFFMNPGGKGANQAVAAARLGGAITFIANVGDDLFGRQSIEHFQRENIHTEFISSDPDHASGVALINVDHQGENSITVAPGANANLSIAQIDQAFNSLLVPGIVLLQLEIPLATVEHTIRKAYQLGHRIILNPAPAQSLDKSLFKYLYVITPNKSEAALLTGVSLVDTTSAKVTAEKLHQLGVENVVITLGAKGAYLHSPTLKQLLPSPSAKALDSTGAGDCFNGALAVALSENQTLDKAVSFACAAAAISVTRLGAQASMPWRKEVSI